MQLKFKQQRYQAEAAAAVVDVFAGQPKQGRTAYLRDLGSGQAAHGQRVLPLAGAQGYANAPVKLGADELLANIRRVQRGRRLHESQALCGDDLGCCHLDVEMETGTGKTYVYTKTMLELHAAYGWTKFIVVVPSVAIREGVLASMQATEQHFFELYGCSVHPFIYNSKRLHELDAFAASPDMCCMIINMQAFNSSLNESKNEEGRKGNKDARIIFSERDEFGSRRPIDVVAATRPIVILDEPQKMGGANSATHKGIARFNPLFTLGYSATHRVKHDLVYALDALDAYNQRLVKRIEVKGFKLRGMRGTDGYLHVRDIVVSKNVAPRAVIEFKKMGANGTVRKVVQRFKEGDDLYEASGPTRLEAYQGYAIAPGGIVPAALDAAGVGYVRFLNGEVVRVGEVRNDSAQEDMQRVQVRETIRSHLQKEEALFARGVKCLSLFFIDEVAKYRSADGGTAGVYARVFEEEYERCVKERLAQPTLADVADGAYRAYLQRDAACAVHSGYFSVDKKGRAIDSKVKRGQEYSDDVDAYDLILRDKERLLSFEEPVRFIFSHSALREGWDNPNIFQICTLKESASEVGKRQEVGRGMRLAVDAQGNRQDVELLGEQGVHELNVLTVVASESYESFVGALQDDIAATLRERPKCVGEGFFAGTPLAIEGVEVSFTQRESKAVYRWLVKRDFVDEDDAPTQECRAALADGSFVGGYVEYFAMKVPGEPLADEAHARAAAALLASVHDPHALDGLVQHAPEKVHNRLNGNFSSRQFQALWQRINRQHAYTVAFDDEELRRDAIARIDAGLTVSAPVYTLTTGLQRADASREQLDEGTTFAATGTRTQEVRLSNAGTDGQAAQPAYDLVGEVASAARITRRSAAAILAGIDGCVFAQFALNPEEFIKKCAGLIAQAKAVRVVEHISYHETDDAYDSSVFTDAMPAEASRALPAKKNVQDYVVADSGGERAFAEALERAGEVEVYAKLPRGFTIPTPVGAYAPDWAIAFKEGSVRHLYFVAETKGSMSTLELRGVEAAKIACAKKLFESLPGRDVRYHQVASYDDLLEKIGARG